MRFNVNLLMRDFHARCCASQPKDDGIYMHMVLLCPEP